jgi:hypothetical protein
MTQFWDGESVVDSRILDPQQLRCPKCGFVGSIDLFDCCGIDIEMPEHEIGPDDNDVWCPRCLEEIPAVFVTEEPT